MSVWEAFWWGGVAAASLCIGEALAGPMERRHRLTGLVMGFGAGALLSAVAYELIPETNLEDGAGIGIAVLLGAVAYFVADQVLDRRGARARQQIASGGRALNTGGSEVAGSGVAMFLGALLDGIPESFILGITLALGGSINVAFVTAVFVSNIPEGVAGTLSLKAAGYSDRRILQMWTGLSVTCAVAAALGYLLGHVGHVEGLRAAGFAAGAMLTMLSDSMLPEAFEHGGKAVGLVVVLGYLVAAALSVAQP